MRAAADDALAWLADVAPIDAADMAVVVAHPDDETIGAGGQLQRLRGARIVHVTDGAPLHPGDARRAGFATRDAYAAARRRELESAMAAAGVPLDRLTALGFVDQEAMRGMAKIARRLADIFAAEKIATVLTHPYEGGHPDHDAVACAVHLAATRVARDGGAPPHVVEMASYRAGPDGVLAQEFLPNGGPVLEARLSDERLARKKRMLDAYVSQAGVLSWFAPEIERFRLAPDYDFARPPHDDALLYETFGWGVSSEDWRRRAAMATAKLEARR